MKPLPTVSVIMNCYNSERFLREAINSVYSQTFQDWEIIFFDNHSTDNSPIIAASYDQRLRYCKNEQTVPLGEARNLAIAKARGQYIAFLDCDDIWLPEKLELQLASFNRPSSREIGFSYTDAMRIDSKGADLLSYSQEKQLAEGDVYINLIYSSFIACSAGMIKSAVLSEIGGFDPDFEFVEEWDLWIRIASQYDLACVNKPLTKIRIHSNNASKNIEGQFHEKMRLARLIMSRDQTVTRHCQKAIKFAEVQFRLSKLLLAKEVKQKFISLARALYTMVKAPVISLTLIKRHLSIDILRAFRKKYLSGEPHAA